MYANTVDFGSNAFGIKTAAKTYFSTTPLDLKPEEAAVLVGLLKATSAYNPKINPENSKKRRNTVLSNTIRIAPRCRNALAMCILLISRRSKDCRISLST